MQIIFLLLFHAKNGIINYQYHDDFSAEKEGARLDWQLVATYAARAIALLIAIPFHEAAHAWAASRLGDDTAKDAGRLSMNPLRHFDPMGAVCMLIVGFGWARPVPIAATSNFKNPKRDMALSAAAGPLSNLLLAFVFVIVYKVMYYLAPQTAVWMFIFQVVSTMVSINITLAVFNMLPVPPLDGSRIFLSFLPQNLYFGVMRYERFIMFGLFALLWLGVLNRPLGFLVNGAVSILFYLTGFVEIILRAILSA